MASRLRTIKNADQILVLERGKIIERGTHRTLLANNGPYTRLYDLQLREQEEFEARLTQNQFDLGTAESQLVREQGEQTGDDKGQSFPSSEEAVR